LAQQRLPWVHPKSVKPEGLESSLSRWLDTPHLAGNYTTWADEMVHDFTTNLTRFRQRQPLHERVI
jgi:hypothetical protein